MKTHRVVLTGIAALAACAAVAAGETAVEEIVVRGAASAEPATLPLELAAGMRELLQSVTPPITLPAIEVETPALLAERS
jgi:hypothetical protein